MPDRQACALIRERIFAHAGCKDSREIVYGDADTLRVYTRGGRTHIDAPDRSGMARGLFLAACALRDGKPVPEIEQKRHFASCGAMLDMSRGAVMTLEALKRYVDASAALGLNLLMLYTEDTYTVDGYPYLGHLRGRYTADELRALDDYADQMGVELVPCIQTLAHMEQFLQWESSAPLADNDRCLLIDEPETYRLIEAELRAVRACFRTDRIHIGMDEAHGMGLGNYYQKHGATDRYALFQRHLRRVMELCDAQGFRPIIWSDMYFRLGSKKNEYYDPDAVIPDAVVRDMPDVALCYWDYYHFDRAFYAQMLKKHQQSGKEIVFAGVSWSAHGFLPDVQYTLGVTHPALRACLERGVQTVIACHWGDDGCEADYFLSLPQLPLYSEYCWLGESCDQRAVDDMALMLTGLDAQTVAALGCTYRSPDCIWQGKVFFYCDPLYPLYIGLVDTDGYDGDLTDALTVLDSHADDARCRYAAAFIRIVRGKAQLTSTLREAYLCGDRDTVGDIANRLIPELLGQYEDFLVIYREQWESSRKRNGWEVACQRIGGATERLKDARRELNLWLDGTRAEIVELEEPPLRAVRRGGLNCYRSFACPGLTD